jgi:hypothetical protein
MLSTLSDLLTTQIEKEFEKFKELQEFKEPKGCIEELRREALED